MMSIMLNWMPQKQKRFQKCLIVSEIIYRFFSVFDRVGEYKINIILMFYPTYTRGHAWVTRNGEKFLLSNHSVVMSDYSIIGENKKYRYYIKEDNLKRMYMLEKLKINRE